MTGDPMPAVLLQLSEHAQLLASLDQREAAHYHAAQQHLGELTELIEALGTTLQDQSAVLVRLDELTQRIPVPAAPDEDDSAEPQAYEPGSAPRWWQLAGEARGEALGKLRAWVERVYRPGYGQLAATLGACWEHHPLCLYGLDVLSELWSVLYLQARRTPAVVSAQAEFQARIVPALAAQLATETTRCGHTRVRTALDATARSQP